MKAYKRIISVFFAFAILICVAVPARADYQSSSNIWQWIAQSTGEIPQHILGNISTLAVCPESNDAKHHAASCVWDGVAGHYVCTCDICGQTFIATYSDLNDAYDNYVNDMTFKGYNSSGDLLYKPTVYDIAHIDTCRIKCNSTYFTVCDSNGLDLSSNIHFQDYGFSLFTTQSMYINSVSDVVGVQGVKLTVPYEGTYRLLDSLCYSVEVLYNGNLISGASNYSSSILSSQVYTLDDETFYYVSVPDVTNKLAWGRGQVSVKSFDFVAYMPQFVYHPTQSFYQQNTQYSVDYRPTSITGDYSVVGDNNEVTVFDETIFNEDNSTFYNPVTGDTTNITNWSYDYSTRTYNMTDENDNSSTLTYGDDNIIINDGGNTFTIYYGDVRGSSGGGSSSESTDTGVFGAIGNLLGTLVNGLLGGIAAFLTKIFDGLTSLATVIGEKLLLLEETILGWFDTIPAIFSGFLAFLTAAFPFIPSEIMLLLTFGLAAVVFIGIIKAIRR